MQLLDRRPEVSQHFSLFDTGRTWFRSPLVDMAKLFRDFDQWHPYRGESLYENVEALLCIRNEQPLNVVGEAPRRDLRNHDAHEREAKQYLCTSNHSREPNWI